MCEKTLLIRIKQCKFLFSPHNIYCCRFVVDCRLVVFREFSGWPVISTQFTINVTFNFTVALSQGLKASTRIRFDAKNRSFYWFIIHFVRNILLTILSTNIHKQFFLYHSFVETSILNPVTHMSTRIFIKISRTLTV